MNKILFALIAVIMMGLTSCENTEKKEVQTLFQSVMEVHDGVMPKMDAIHEARKALKDKMNTPDSTEVSALLEKLSSADEAMMVWMEEFNSSFETMPIQEQKKYLESEMQRITKVKDLMLGAIDESQKWINAHENTVAK
ncbi:MAG: hypothetical protein U0V54_10485 [Saprospiraceae bacterium]|nr:hypothetical protein [Saprospiraceae bacterium]